MWLESANDATADYAAQQKKLEGIVAPIVAKASHSHRAQRGGS